MSEQEDETEKSRERQRERERVHRTVAERMRSEVIKLNYYQS